MPTPRHGITTLFGAAGRHLRDRVDTMKNQNPFVKADFECGGATLYKYLSTHRNRYHRHVGAHLLVFLYEAGPEIFEGFAEKQRRHGWHFDMTREEGEALKRARDITCTHNRISNLRYATNVFEQLTNSRQLLRMLGLGAVAGSAGILLGLGELFFLAREASKDFITSTLGIEFADPDAAAQANTEFVDIANEITRGAANADGTLDATLVAERVENLVTRIEEAGNADAAVHYMNADTTYIVGILTGIAFLVVGRGFVQIVMEGLYGTTSKIDALIRDMDEYADWKLGRSPHIDAVRPLHGDLVELPGRTLILPGDAWVGSPGAAPSGNAPTGKAPTGKAP